MYQRYAETSGWNFEIIEEQQTELGGIKEVVAHVKGEEILPALNMKVVCIVCNACPKPKTGAEFTHPPPVAVLPEAEDVDINLAPMIFALIPCAALVRVDST